MNHRARFGLLAAVVAFVCVQARAVEPTLASDTHVNAALPSVNSGTLSNIAVGAGYIGLLQFDLSTLPAGTTAAQISKATLRLYVNRVDTGGTISVLPLASAWSEYGVTYSTLPATGASLGTLAVAQTGTFVTVDITTQVKSWLNNPASNNGLALTAASAAVQFDSKENDLTAHPASLDVTLSSQGGTGATGPAGPAGPQGPQGLTGANGVAGPAGATGPAGEKGATGTLGPAGATGATGVAGPAGLTGPTGPAGSTGAAGPQGVKGLPGVGIEGPYASATNYGLNDVVTWQGSSWYSLIASNHGNTPDQSPAYWAVLAAAGIGIPGATGAAGPTGPPGLTGPPGPIGITGLQGPTGVQGPRGLPGLGYQRVYASTNNYALGDVVLWQGSSWVSLVDGNHGNTPSLSPAYWGVLTQQGPVGATGATGVQGPAGATGALGPVGPPGERGDQGLQGIPGQAGAQGISGATGSQGLSGPAGPQGVAGPVGMTFQGTYNSVQNYALADGVIYNGSGYVSLLAGNHGNTPDQSPATWALFATGTPGAAGLAGAPGAMGVTGPQGQQGFPGATGPQGPIGPQGPPTVTYTGNYSPVTSYNLNDAAAYNGSTYVSMVANNHGNTPEQSPSYWTVLVAQGAPGAAGPAGVPGAAGAPGAAGPAGASGALGPQGPQGPAGAAGINFRSAWITNFGYVVNDAVTYQGATYLAQVANSSAPPDSNGSVWTVLAAAGSTGATGAAGTAATIAVGTVTTGAAGSAASVTNSGSANAAVLNFTLPQGAAGASGSGGGSGAGSGTSGIPYAAMYHAVSYAASYYSVNNTNQSASETANVLTWVPQGCSATRLDVFSQQGATITVTLRTGTPGAMADSPLSCQVATGKSCSATGSVAIVGGQFVDIGITHSDSTAVGVWTAVICN